MRLGSYTVALLSRHVSSLALLAGLVLFASAGSIGCGGKHQEAKVAEADPWAGYKGTYAPGAADSAASASADDKPKSATTSEADTKAAEPKPDAKPGKKPKGKRGKKGAAADASGDAPAAPAAPAAAAAAPDKPVSADTSSPAALYGDGTGSGSATTTSASEDTAAPAPKKPKKKAAKKKKPATPAQ